nr:hypothetical protein [Ardenticatena sp.]
MASPESFDLPPRTFFALEAVLFGLALVLTLGRGRLTLAEYARMLAWVSLGCWVLAGMLWGVQRKRPLPAWLHPATLFFSSMLPFATSTMLAWLGG